MGRRWPKSGQLVFLGLVAMLFAAAARAQFCPTTNDGDIEGKVPSVRQGTLRYHNGTRPWLGLIPDHPACGAKEIELAFSTPASWQDAERMRDCRVKIDGKISESPTAYYSTDLNLFDAKITPERGCHPFPPNPDYAKIKIPDWISGYQVTVFINVQANKPLLGRAVSSDATARPLTPWQAYAQVSLNGEKDMDLGCRDGFRITSFSSMPPDASAPAPLSKGWARIYSSQLGAASLTIECRRN